MTRRCLSIVLLAVLWLLPGSRAHAQGTAKLLLTVVDETGAVIPNALVTATRLDDPARALVGPVKSNETGVATIEGLTPGRYDLQAEFPGFQKRVMSNIRLRAGDNRQVAVLTLEKIEDEVTVGRDKQTAAADPKSTFGTALTREQIEALSDDPEEMRRQIMDLAGGDAVLRIDSFEGGQLPPKAQIKSIHVTRDQFAAENHYAGGHFIDIVTQPGSGPLRAGTNFRFRDRSLNASNPQTRVKGPEQTRSYGINLSGSLIKDKSSFSLAIDGSDSYDAPTVFTAGPEGRRAETLPLKRRRDMMFAYGTFDFALTKDQTLRLSFNTERFDSSNLGVGAYDERERAYSTEQTWGNLRIQEVGPIGRRFFLNTRLQLTYQRSRSIPDVELPTVRIIDARTNGGAQQRGGNLNRSVNLLSDLDYVRGIHSFRTGLDINGTWVDSDDESNYLGTYTFESVEAFLAGRPRSYTRRIGDPHIDYRNVFGGIYVQDDIRIRKNLTLSPGLRYELHTLVSDYNNFAPRFGINWAPFASGRTTVRASAGIFYDWFSQGTYEQTLRVDGFRQRELNILDPSWPDPGDTGIIPPTNMYLLGEDARLSRAVRFSAGVQQTFTPRIRGGFTYARSRYNGLSRGENINAPVNGTRPDETFANVIRTRADAESIQHQLSGNVSVSLTTPGPAAQAPRFNWRRGSLNASFSVNRSRSNSEGAFSPPFSGSLENEWGPTNGSVNRMNVGFNSQAIRNLNLFLSMNVTSGAPYTIRTGTDDNGDLIFNDRPDGIGRNTERGSTQIGNSLNASYTISFGKRQVQAPDGVMVMGGTVMRAMPASNQARYRLVLSLGVQNFANRVNHTGWNGTMTSPFFRQPTGVGAPRKVDVGMSFSF